MCRVSKFILDSPIQRINQISSTIMAGSKDSKSLISDLSNNLKKTGEGYMPDTPLLYFKSFIKSINITSKVSGADQNNFLKRKCACVCKKSKLWLRFGVCCTLSSLNSAAGFCSQK